MSFFCFDSSILLLARGTALMLKHCAHYANVCTILIKSKSVILLFFKISKFFVRALWLIQKLVVKPESFNWRLQ